METSGNHEETTQSRLNAPIQRVLDALGRVGAKPKQINGDFYATCPVCRRTRSVWRGSLAISTGLDGRVLLRCFGDGCSTRDIVARIGLTMRDLFAQPASATDARRVPAAQDAAGSDVRHVRHVPSREGGAR